MRKIWNRSISVVGWIFNIIVSMILCTVSAESIVSERVELVIQTTRPFNNYIIPYSGIPNLVLTGVSVRPANLFFEALFAGTSFDVTKPGSGELFALIDKTEENKKQLIAFKTQQKIGNYCRQKAYTNPEEIVSFSAKGKTGDCYLKSGKVEKKKVDLELLFGSQTFRLSRLEIQEIIDSQNVFTSAWLPVTFYKALKQAMLADEVIVLPGNEQNLKVLEEMGSNVQFLMKQVSKQPGSYGFRSLQDVETLKNLTLYQIGAMVVKSEKCYVFADANMQIRERYVGAKDDIILINACGIRGINKPKTQQKYNKAILVETYKTVLYAAKSGFVIFPAMGLGVWGGDPDLYWRSFLDAVVDSDQELECILVNPGHRATSYGRYKGCSGNEFQVILDEYKERYKSHFQKSAKLNKVVNLYLQKSDVLELAYQLKQVYPEQRISVVNASDPDVTLGYHVGEYTNNIPHANTTEENYAAMTTSGLNFEGVTGIHLFGQF